MNHTYSIKFELASPGIGVTVVVLDKLRLGKSSNDFETYETSLFEDIRSNNRLEDLVKDPLLQSYRTLHWSFGMDPTKKRVSSEAVLRRVLQGQNLWRISDLVDIVNLASAYHKVPIGLIDSSKINGQLTIRRATKGEIFQRIGGESIECRGREIVLSDSNFIVCYGFAIHDSERTKVTRESTQVLLLHYGTKMTMQGILTEATRFTLELIKRWVNCAASESITYENPD